MELVFYIFGVFMSLLVKIGENDNVNITSNMTKYTSFFFTYCVIILYVTGIWLMPREASFNFTSSCFRNVRSMFAVRGDFGRFINRGIFQTVSAVWLMWCAYKSHRLIICAFSSANKLGRLFTSQSIFSVYLRGSEVPDLLQRIAMLHPCKLRKE